MKLTKLKLVSVIFICSILTASLFSQQLSNPFNISQSNTTSRLSQYFPEVAYAKASGIWLVVWQEGIPTGDGTGIRAQDIYCARVDASGTVLDPDGILLCGANNFQKRPAVASNGTDFFVVWHDLRSDTDWDIYGARISSDGTVIDPNGFPVSAKRTSNQCYPDVVYAGGSYHVVWLDARHMPEYRIYGTRVSPDGAVLDTNGTEIIRLVTDTKLASWANAPFAPGKKGKGWHEYAIQPEAPTIVTNDSMIIVSTFGAKYGQDATMFHGDYWLRTVNSTTGEPTGTLQSYPLKELMRNAYNKTPYHVRLAHVAKGVNGQFITASTAMDGGFGLSGRADWIISTVSANGIASQSLPSTIYYDTIQSTLGYRADGPRPNQLSIDFDGMRSVLVVNRYLQPNVKPRTGDCDILGIIIDGNNTASAPPFEVATGSNYQDFSKISAGAMGNFLVVWQEESVTTDSKIVGRIITVN